MLSDDAHSSEKGPAIPSNDSVDSHSVEMSSSEDLALEKRVLRKTDMVVLPMVSEMLLNIL